MKIKHIFLSAAVLLMVVVLVFSACRRKDTTDKDTTSAEDNTLADKSFEDIGQISNESAKGSVSSYKTIDDGGILSGSCATVTIVRNPDSSGTITVDFGSVACLCKDNHWRQGKLFISYTKGYHNRGYWDSLCSITVSTSPDNSYFVGSDQSTMHQLIGTKTITNKGHNFSHHMNWDIAANGEVIKANGQGTIQWQSQRNREWIQGENTPLLWTDDVYGLTGNANGTSANNTQYTVNITSQLIRKMDPGCIRWFTAGTLDFTPGSKAVRHVDYSPPHNGQCDNVATVTINSITYTVYMK